MAGILALSLVNYLLRFARWQHYLTILGHPVPWLPSGRIYFAGFALTTTPGKMGELLRGVMLKPFGVPLTESTAAFFSERTADLLTILVLTSSVFWLYPNGAPLVAGVMAFALAVIVAVQFPGWIHALDAWAARRRGALGEGAGAPVRHRAAASAAASAGPRCRGRWSSASSPGAPRPSPSTGCSIALGHPLPLPMSVFIYAFAMLVGSVAFLPGGLGGNEATMVALLIMNGLPQPVAVSATLICRLATLWFAVALGARGHAAEPVMRRASWGNLAYEPPSRQRRLFDRAAPLPASERRCWPGATAAATATSASTPAANCCRRAASTATSPSTTTTGMLRAEAGVLLDDIIRSFLPRGWFLPVTPGTRFVTLGGALANDVHGKNHHVAGTFGSHVRALRAAALRRRAARLQPDENAELFAATIGGLGLTGLVTWVELQCAACRARPSRVENRRFHGLDEFFALNAEFESEPRTCRRLDRLPRARRRAAS